MDVHPPKYGIIGFDPWPYDCDMEIYLNPSNRLKRPRVAHGFKNLNMFDQDPPKLPHVRDLG